MNRFDKPYRIAPSFDLRKNIEMFDFAAKLDTHEMLQHSLINQIPFDISDEEGNTLLHIVINVDSRKASQHSKLGVIKFLVNNGANPDKPNKYNQTPLHLACHYQYDLIVEYLLSIDVNPNFKDNMGLTPFHYLLTGDIKTIEKTGEILNFIPPPKKVDVVANDKIIEIKKTIYDLLIVKLIKDEFPILKTFSNTIANILDNDAEFINQRIELEQKIAKLALDTSAPNYLLEIKNTVDIALKSIGKKIEKLFNNFPEISELQIHNTEKTSWSHPTNTQPLSLIKNGNIKKQIKDEIKLAANNILNLTANFNQYNYNITSYEEDGLNEIMGAHFTTMGNNFTKPRGSSDYFYSGNFNRDYRTINDINDKIKHTNAFDNASSIIDFANLKYAGGPRNITLNLPANPIINEVIGLSQVPTDDNKIFKTLAAGFLTNIAAICDTVGNPNGLNFFVFTQAEYRANYRADLLRYFPNPDYGMRFSVLCYLIFSFVAIKSPDRFEELLANPYLNPPNNFLKNNEMVIKWFKKFMNGENVASFIYGMWCDLSCTASASNLDGSIPLNLAILISGIANNSTNLTQSMYNSYKPHLISDICSLPGLNPEVKIASMTMLLLNENCSNMYFRNIDADPNRLSGIVGVNIDKNIILIGKLVLNYFQNPSGFNTGSTSEEDKLYRLYSKPGKKPIHNLINIILDLYEKMVNKPLKQTIIDFVYLLNSYDQARVKNIDDFKAMSVINIVKPAGSLDLYKNQIPSHYGLENVIIDEKIFTGPAQIVENHFRIAHVFGLYFEGMCNPHQNYALGNPFNITTKDKKGKVTKEFYITPSGINEHSFQAPNSSSLDDDQVPLAFNNVILITNNLTLAQKFQYYNAANRKIVNPSIHSYFVLVVKRIQLYQKKIFQLLKTINGYVDELVKGKTTNLGSLITILYPQLVSYCKIIDSYKSSYDLIGQNYSDNEFWKSSDLRKIFRTPETYPYLDLAKNINTINSSFYTYYYVFSPDKLIKLSKFNFYQIPTTSSNKYLLYTGTNDLNVFTSAEHLHRLIQKLIHQILYLVLLVNFQSETMCLFSTNIKQIILILLTHLTVQILCLINKTNYHLLYLIILNNFINFV